MTTKYFEIRDRGTFIPAIAIQLKPTNEAERYLAATAGYGTSPESQACYVLLARLDCGGNAINYDEHKWTGGTRTMRIAHRHIRDNWDSLNSGDVVCVEYIVGERDAPKDSQRFEAIL